MTLKLGMQHWVLEYYQVCLNDDPGLTWTYFTARSTFVSCALELIVYDLKVAQMREVTRSFC